MVKKILNRPPKGPLQDHTGARRSSKFYFQNEKALMKSLGLDPVPQSGGGWIHKEDGENEVLIAQLKSTDKESYRLNILDLEKLEYHAMVSHKAPLFIVQFLNKDKIYLLMELANLEDVYKAIAYKEAPQEVSPTEVPEGLEGNVIKASREARDKFFKEKEETWKKKKRK